MTELGLDSLCFGLRVLFDQRSSNRSILLLSSKWNSSRQVARLKANKTGMITAVCVIDAAWMALQGTGAKSRDV